MSAHVLVVGVVGVDEGGLGLGVVIVLILVLLGLSGLKLNVLNKCIHCLTASKGPTTETGMSWLLGPYKSSWLAFLGYCCFLTSLAI